MDGDLPKPAPKIVNLRSGVALVAGIVLLIISNSDVIFSSTSAHIDEQKSLVRLLIQEIGFALIVALIIWAMWEYFSQAESEDQWNARIERVAKSVFFGVFKRNFPEELIQEANLLLLEQNFVRSGCHLLYTLRDDSFARDDGRQMPCVILEAVVRFKIKNIGNESLPCPLATSLPNPMHPAIKPKCAVHRVQVRAHGGELIDQDLNEAEKKFRIELADNLKHQARFELPPVVPIVNQMRAYW
jgi:hypothetical protein